MAIEATVVLSHGTDLTAGQLLHHAARTLPRYALPEHLAIADALPQTATEKIDRMTLRANAVARRTSTPVAAP
jgi:acyl-coenzyme A synthetase/AMP-(fatty) acid ligase